ncbi:MAG: hypothetical protein ACPGN3_06755 [Opitutales bacterium]
MEKPPEETPEEDKPIDVMDILKENLEVSKKNEKAIDIVKKKSKRKRDYWLILILTNLIFGGLAITFSSSVVALVYILSGALIFSVAFTWIMWVVLSDY